MKQSEQINDFYIHKIREGLSLRQRGNPGYSLRAYSRDLGIHPATLSQVINGKRPLPFKNSKKVADTLKLGPKERTLFFESFHRSKTAIDEIKIDQHDERFMLDESYYRVIAEWEHCAVLSLMDTKDFILSEAELTRRLGVTQTRAKVVIENLLLSGLLQRTKTGTFTLTHKAVRTTEDVSSQALRASHLENLEIGKRKLEEVGVELRDFSAMTLAIDPRKIFEAKTIIREFRQKMAALLRDGKKTEVFQLAIQFYPLTIMQEKK